jgi:APA family basic amino acid/polyamine antiporter
LLSVLGSPSPAPRPALSLFDATMLVIGCIIGAGVFFAPSDMAVRSLDGRLWMAAWAVGGVAALAGALTFAELGGLFPRTGGTYVFLRQAFGPLPAFLFGWSIELVIAPGALAWVARNFAQNLAHFVPALGPLGQRWTAVALILLATWLNVRGVKLAGLVGDVFTLAKLAAALVLVAAGLAWSGAPLGPLPGAVVPPVDPGMLGGFAGALVPVLFAYGGWQNACYAAGEVRDPARNVPRAMVGGTLVVVACYLAINWSYLRVLSPEAIASSRGFASRVAEAAFGGFGSHLVAAGIVVSTFGISVGVLLANPRIAAAMADDGLFLPAFGRRHPRFGTPWVSVLVMGLWAAALVWADDLSVWISGPGARGLGLLLDSVVFADWLFYALAAASLFTFRKRLPHAERPYRCPGYPWVPGFFLAGAAAVTVLTLVRSGATELLLGAGILALGLPFYAWFRGAWFRGRARARRPQA